jgi:hypothetical protein
VIAVSVLLSWALLAIVVAGVLIVWGILNVIADMGQLWLADRRRR